MRSQFKERVIVTPHICMEGICISQYRTRKREEVKRQET